MTNWAAHQAILAGAFIIAAVPLSAEAKTSHHHAAPAHHRTAYHHTSHGTRYASLVSGRYHHGVRYAGISCVPFARAESGIILTGNAATWWDEAEGRYARGNAPEPGSVLNFRANASMHLGHVAVVRDVVNSRQIEIDQANWWGPGAGAGRISRSVAVVDVSPHNDWTQVRVALGHSGTFGSVYPTYGFIYQRAPGDAPMQVASAGAHARDLRAHAGQSQTDEVAEAPADAPAGPLSLDAPDHNSLR